jgi:hypothetical protein
VTCNCITTWRRKEKAWSTLNLKNYLMKILKGIWSNFNSKNYM